MVMESPYFKNHWSNFAPRARYAPSMREVPVHRPARPSPKVVSIPVHFVGSERSRSDSALKIQKVFRGFLVRTSMKKIAAIKGEVDEIEKKISQKETLELIRKESKERLRVTETLMSLLFRLDSVRGVDSGVRDCRKTVIKKAIALQERVDAIVAGGDLDQTLETKENGECLGVDDKAADQTPELEPESLADHSNSSEIDLDRQDFEIEEDCDSELQNLAEHSSPAEEGNGENEEKEESAMADAEAVTKENENKEFSEDRSDSVEASAGMNGDDDDDDARSESGSSVDPQSPTGAVEEEEDAREIVEADKNEGKMEENLNSRAREENNKRNKELLEKMMEENEKMMRLMADLYERNQQQTRLLSSLSQRVEQLERAFVCDKLRKKKKRLAASIADCLEKCPDATKKSGTR